MYNLTLHIEYLLLRHDCVVLPGIGAFINVRHPARLDSDTGIWHPMTREVRFNGALTHDDGLLANSYARKYQTAFQDGRDLLRRDLQRLQDILESDGEATIGQLGILRLNDGAISFRPQNTPAQIAAALGYMEARMRPAEAKPESDIEAATHNNKDVAPEAEVIERGKRKERAFDTERNYYIAVNKIFARTAACLLVVVAAAISLIVPMADNRNVDQASVIPVDNIIRKSLSHTERQTTKTEAAPSERVSGDTTDASTDTPEAGVETSQQRFHAIVATFRTQSDAETFMAQHRDSGYELRAVPTKTRVRVAAISSADRTEVQQLMQTDDFKRQFSSVWIWSDSDK